MTEYLVSLIKYKLLDVLVIVYIKWESLDITYYLNYSLHM